MLETVAGASHLSTASICPTNCSKCLSPSTASTCTTNCNIVGASHPSTAGHVPQTVAGASYPSTAGTCATNCSRCLSSLHCEYMHYKLEQMPLTPPLRVHVLQTVAGAFPPPLRVNVVQIVAGSSHPSTAGTCVQTVAGASHPSTAGTCATNCSRCISPLHCKYMYYKL